MLEPSKPVTLKMRYTPYPAVELQSDEGRVLRPDSIILRHRHLKRQFTIVPSASRERPLPFAPPRCTYQLVAPIPAVPAVTPPSTLPFAVARHPASPVPPPAAADNSSSVGVIPLAADSSVVAPAPRIAIPPVVACPSGVAAPPNASSLPPVIAADGISPAVDRVNSGKGEVVSSVQPLPVQAARRNTSRSHEIVDTSNNNLIVRRGQHAIRDKKGKTTWFYSDGLTYLLEPPSVEGARLGDLYVHTAANRDQQIWIFNRNSQWEKIQLYHPHPVLSGYVLHRVSDGEPRWIQKSTVTTYRGREKRYQLICRRSEAEAASVTSSGRAGTP